MKIIERRLLDAIRKRHGEWVSRNDLRVELNMSANHVTGIANMYPEYVEVKWDTRKKPLAMAFRWIGGEE